MKTPGQPELPDLREIRDQLDRATHLIHRAETEIRAGRPVEAEQLRAIRTLIAEVKTALRRRKTPIG